VIIDPETGKQVSQNVLPQHVSLFEPILNTKSVSPINPNTAPWPYTGTASEERVKVNGGSFRLPDLQSGFYYLIGGASTETGEAGVIILGNCRSLVRVSIQRDAESGKFGMRILEEDVHEQDRQAIDNFLREVEVD
jgi:hypothetical protein